MKKGLLIIMVLFVFLLSGCKDKQQMSLEKYSKDTDIVFTIYSYDGKSESQYMINSLGHAWLSVENNTGDSIMIGDYELLSNRSLYFGSWANSANVGICYNLETHFRNKYDRYDGVISLSINIDLEDVEKISNFILNNDKWGFINNCSSFSIHCWNQIVNEEIHLDTYAIYTPTKLCNNLMQYKEYKVNKEMINYDEIFYYDGGIRQVLELC